MAEEAEVETETATVAGGGGSFTSAGTARPASIHTVHLRKLWALHCLLVNSAWGSDLPHAAQIMTSIGGSTGHAVLRSIIGGGGG